MVNTPPWIKPFLQTLSNLLALFSKLKVLQVVTGGLAVSLLSKPRFTQDIDIVALLTDEKLRQLFALCQKFNFKPRLSNALDFARERHVILLRHKKTGLGVDIAMAILPFQKEMLRQAKSVRLGKLSLKVARPEDLIITKAVAHRPRDIVDIEQIIETHPNLDVRRIRSWVKEFSKVLEMPEVLNDLDQLLRRTKKTRRSKRRGT